MKRCMLWAICLMFCLTLIGCGKTQKAQPTPTGQSTLSQFESYITQTAFSFPKSWEYQDDSEQSGMTAVFAFSGGNAAVQFLWMNEEQVKSNVFLQQLDIDEVQEQAYTAGPYEGKLVVGSDRGTYTIAFEGSRNWYDTKPKLYMRIVMNTDNGEIFEKERPNFQNLLQSVTTTADEPPQAVDISTLYKYDYIKEFGLALSAPETWLLEPYMNEEDSLISLTYAVAAGENTFRVELATVSQKEYDQMVQSLKELDKGSDVYDFTYQQKDGVLSVTCLREGRMNRVRLISQKVGGKIRYLWASSTLRPVIDAAYFENLIVPMIDGIEWKK